MNDQEARTLLLLHLEQWRGRSWAELRVLVLLDDQETCEVTGPSGVRYQIEVQAFWDDQPEGNIRVLGGIDDGGVRAYFPLCTDFIKAPSGAFIGE